MLEMLKFKNREEWLEGRKSYIGGSDAAAVLGMNPYKTNVDLWLEKTGQKIPEDISGRPYVQYGHDAEPHLRELFKLDHPDYQVFYVEDNLFRNSKFPWAHASLDGWLTAPNGREGILEIKTTNIMQSMQKENWDGRIPDNYYLQVLHYLMVMERDFAILKAQLKYEYSDHVFLQTREYFIDREDVEEDIAILARAEEEFWRSIKTKTRPALKLPEF